MSAEAEPEFSSRDRKAIALTGDALTVDEVVSVARHRARARVSDAALTRVRRAREVVEEVLSGGGPVYGTTTGLGAMSRYQVPPEELERFSFATVADQTGSYGRPLSREVVRAMMVSRANGMAKAGVGVRRELIIQLVEVLNAGVHPIVRRVGSVGQGDLSEMADIGKVLIGRGFAEVDEQVLPGDRALATVGLQPIELAPKEALALISANGVTTGHGALVLADSADLLESLQSAAALSLEGFAGNLSVVHPEAGRLRPHAGQIQAAARLRELLEGSYLWRPGAARNLQDPLSFRCVPQAHGALHDALSHTREALETELNSAGDNPLVSVEDEVIVSVGNFDVVTLATVFDFLRVTLACALQVLDERVQKLLWSHFSGLTTGLAGSGEAAAAVGGMDQLGRSCAAHTAEARLLANPVSLDYRGQLAEGIEDHGSMAPLAVRTTSELVSLGHQLVAFELIVAAQAIDLRGQPKLGSGTRHAYGLVRDCVPPLVDATDWDPDIERLTTLIADGELARRVALDAGEPSPLADLERARVAAEPPARDG